MIRNLRRCWRHFRDSAHRLKILFMSAMDSGPFNKNTDRYLTRICMKINLCEYDKEGGCQQFAKN